MSLHEQSRGLGVAKLREAECLLGMHEALGLCPARHRLGMVVPACYPSTGKKAEKLEIKVILGCIVNLKLPWDT